MINSKGREKWSYEYILLKCSMHLINTYYSELLCCLMSCVSLLNAWHSKIYMFPIVSTKLPLILLQDDILCPVQTKIKRNANKV